MSSSQTGGVTLEAERRERIRVEKLMARGAIFVFGSNYRGAHGRGAAREAVDEYRAKWGLAEGVSGQTYALPTKDERIQTLPLEKVRAHVVRFLRFAAEHPEYTFAVTRIGCGLAGYTDADIAPMFADAPPNCELPEGWRAALATLDTREDRNG